MLKAETGTRNETMRMQAKIYPTETMRVYQPE